MHKLSRRLGTSFIVFGVLLFAYAAAVVFWRDPVTDIYTAYQQHELRSKLHHDTEVWEQKAATTFSASHVVSRKTPAAAPTTTTHGGQATATSPADRNAQDLTLVRKLAVGYAHAHKGKNGAPLGKLTIGRMGLSEIFVEGTDYWHSLTKGPGHYSITSWPGLGKTTAIAGHRTTWSAPFRYINTLNDGDAITLKMPYGTFTYRVTHHRIVDNGDWSIIKNVGYDQLVLSACHPLYSASHRYVIFARLASVQVPGTQRTLVLPAA
jgi:sortase A